VRGPVCPEAGLWASRAAGPRITGMEHWNLLPQDPKRCIYLGVLSFLENLSTRSVAAFIDPWKGVNFSFVPQPLKVLTGKSRFDQGSWVYYMRYLKALFCVLLNESWILLGKPEVLLQPFSVPLTEFWALLTRSRNPLNKSWGPSDWISIHYFVLGPSGDMLRLTWFGWVLKTVFTVLSTLLSFRNPI